MSGPAGKPKVLLVDDDPRILAGLRRQLHRDFRVVTAAGGDEALHTLSADGDIAVVLSDMRMPGLDGAALLARARVESPHSTRILLTGQTELGAAVRAVNDGQIFRFLTKPCPPETLDACLRAAVRRFSATFDELRPLTGAVADRRLMEVDDTGEVVALGAGTGRFRLRYQPVVALDGGATVGVEAVLGRPDPAGEAVGAGELTVAVGRWMVAAACQEVASWPATGGGPLRVHLSLSARQVLDPGLAAELARSLTLSGLEPHRITLVVPQALAAGAAPAHLETISQWGVRLALAVDETGPAPAGLAFSAVKMGVRRVTHEPGDAGARAVAEAAAEIGRASAAPAIAADVDCADCRATAQDAGCELAQGPFYGPPADPGDLLAGVVTSRR